MKYTAIAFALFSAIGASAHTGHLEGEVSWELLCNPITPATCNADELTPLVVSEYQVVNGGSSSFNYNDLVYEATVGANLGDYDPLSGATGDLTDGVIPTVNFAINSQASSDPYVGWEFTKFTNEGFLPIKFFFSESQTITSLKVSIDNTGGSSRIGAPENVIIGGETYDFPTSASIVYTAEIQLNSPITLAAGTGLDVKITRNVNTAAFVFIFISEIQFFGTCSATFLACIDQEKARCCHKTDSTCAEPERRGLQEGGGIRKLFTETSCLWGNEVFSKKSTDLCLQECFAYGERLCALNEDFGLVHECDDSWWAYDGGKP